MIDIKFLPTKTNSASHVYAGSNCYKYIYSDEVKSNKHRTYYHAFQTDTDALICPKDYCTITNPHDGSEYLEQCKSVAEEYGREVFYGMKGTRCLLCDVSKILSTTDPFLQPYIPAMADSLISDFFKRFKLNKPNFWDE